MRIAEIIGTVDKLYPNQIDNEWKIDWLRRLDRQIKNEVIDTHELPEGYREPEFEDYGMDTELIVEDMFAELYLSYLKMKISLEHVEQDRYTMESTNYNNQYISYQAYYNRNHMPILKKRPIYR